MCKKQRFGSNCVTGSLSSYFAGEASLEDALQEATEAFLTVYHCCTCVCSLFGDIVYSKVTVNEHGVVICDIRDEILGGLENEPLKQDICKKCIENMIKAPEKLINKSLCDGCIHSETCHSEVPVDEKCEYYIQT